MGNTWLAISFKFFILTKFYKCKIIVRNYRVACVLYSDPSTIYILPHIYSFSLEYICTQDTHTVIHTHTHTCIFFMNLLSVSYKHGAPQILQYVFPKNKDNYNTITQIRKFDVDTIQTCYLIHSPFSNLANYFNDVLYSYVLPVTRIQFRITPCT